LCASFYNGGHARAKRSQNLRANIGHFIDKILDGIVQQSGDDLFLIAAIGADQRGHAHQVVDIRDVFALSGLVAMKLRSEGEGAIKLVGVGHGAVGCGVKARMNGDAPLGQK